MRSSRTGFHFPVATSARALHLVLVDVFGKLMRASFAAPWGSSWRFTWSVGMCSLRREADDERGGELPRIRRGRFGVVVLYGWCGARPKFLLARFGLYGQALVSRLMVNEAVRCVREEAE